VERAVACGLAAIAITDHDSVSGVGEGWRAARLRGLEFLPGAEISASLGRVEVHVVGLGIDPRAPALSSALERLKEARSARIDKILARFQALRISIAREEVETRAPDFSALGRVHVAQVLVARGITRTVQEGFDRFMRSGRKAYVPKKTLSCRAAIDVIHAAGGLAILAHPGVGASVEKLVPRLLTLPFDGIEIYHTQHTPGQVTRFVQLALEKDLLVSGGSDCHGTATKSDPDMGKVRVPYLHFEQIQEALRRR
jgi:hypothetical protein